MKKITNYLNQLIPNPKCELNYNNDYELLLATMLSAQTTDKRVNMVTDILFKKYDSLEKFRQADLNDIIEIIRPIGTFNRKAQNIINIAYELKSVNDIVPNDRNFLEGLPGVGRKTTNVVLSNLYNEPYIAVDTHIQRVSKRLGLAQTDNVLETEKSLYKFFKGQNFCRLHHQLLLFGRYYCKAKNPKCSDCGLKDICKRHE